MQKQQLDAHAYDPEYFDAWYRTREDDYDELRRHNIPRQIIEAVRFFGLNAKVTVAGRERTKIARRPDKRFKRKMADRFFVRSRPMN